MHSFSSMHPVTQAVWFAFAAGCIMFQTNPVLSGTAFLGAVLLFLVRNGLRDGTVHLWFFLLFAGMTVVNPLVSHNGATVLVVINGQLITLEALIYGIVSSSAILAVLYLFRTFSQIMTSERLLFLCGILSPKLALVLSMALRYTALFTEQMKKVQMYQKAAGLYKEDNLIDGVLGGVRIFSIMLTWALEHGITTADSMAARGYGTGIRTQFAQFRFLSGDCVFMLLTLGLGTVTAAAEVHGELRMTFYPEIQLHPFTPFGITAYAAYGILLVLPILHDWMEELKWKHYLSKI